MYLSVPCSDKSCVYQSDGICTLETASTKTQINCDNIDCLYYKKIDTIDLKNL